MDHIGGLAKTAVHREVGLREYFCDARDVVSFLNEKFSQNTSPRYVVREINNEDIQSSRVETQLKGFSSIEGSDKFQVAIFKPNETSFLAAD